MFHPGLWTLPAELESLGIAHCQQAHEHAAQPQSWDPQPIRMGPIPLKRSDQRQHQHRKLEGLRWQAIGLSLSSKSTRGSRAEGV